MVKRNVVTGLEWKDIWLLVTTYTELVREVNSANHSNSRRLLKMLNGLIEVKEKTISRNETTGLKVHNTLDDLQRYLLTDNPTFKGVGNLGVRQDFLIDSLINELMARPIGNPLTLVEEQLVLDLSRTFSVNLNDGAINKIKEQIIAVNRSVARFATTFISDMKKTAETIEKWKQEFFRLKNEIESQITSSIKGTAQAKPDTSPDVSTSSSNSLTASSSGRDRSGNVFSWEGQAASLSASSSPSPSSPLELKNEPVARCGSAPNLSPTKPARTLRRRDAIKSVRYEMLVLNLNADLDDAAGPVSSAQVDAPSNALDAGQEEMPGDFGLFSKSAPSSKCNSTSAFSPLPKSPKKK